jgi:hypothetical protein
VTVSDHRELVAALLAVEGVAGASVEPTGGGPGTLRLQLSPGTDEVAVAGTVNRLLRARFGLAVDADRVRILDEPDVVSVAAPSTSEPPRPAPPRPTSPLPPPPLREHAAAGASSAASAAAPRVTGTRIEESMAEPEPATYVSALGETSVGTANGTAPTVHLGRPSRLAIQRVQLVSSGLGVTVSVGLALDDRIVNGEAEGAASQTGVHRSVATATLRAVESVIEGNARFEVEHVELARTGPDQTVLVVLTMVTGRSTQRLSGASVVREDVRQAVIRAVLAAVNRRIEPMLVPGEALPR